MSILDWWRNKKAEREREAQSMERMLTDEERDQQPVPAETYLSATKD